MRRAPGDNVLADQFQTVAAVVPSDWAEKHKRFLAATKIKGNKLKGKIMIEKEMYNKEKTTASPRVEPKLSVLRRALRHCATLPTCR